MQKLLLVLLLLLASGRIIARSPIRDARLARGNKVFIRTANQAEYRHLAKILDYKGYWQVVDTPAAADFVLHVKSWPGWNYRAYAVLEDARTGEVFVTTKKVNTLWTSSSMNMKLGAMRKLVRKQLRPLIPE